MKKQSQKTYDSYGFFSTSLEPESSSTYVPPSLKWKVVDATPRICAPRMMQNKAT